MTSIPAVSGKKFSDLPFTPRLQPGDTTGETGSSNRFNGFSFRIVNKERELLPRMRLQRKSSSD